MAMIKKSSSRYEQKRMSRLESGIRAAQKSGVSANQAKQVVIDTYRVKTQASKEHSVTRLDVDRWDGEVFDRKQEEAVKVHKHIIWPAGTCKQFKGKRSQRFSRPVAKMFLAHPERLEQYNILRDHRFSRFIAIDIITKVYSEKGNNNGDGHEALPLKEIHPLDVTTQGWQKFMGEHKALFAKMYDMRIHNGLSHLPAINSIYKEMDHAYKATTGKYIFDQIDKIQEQMDFTSNSKNTHDLSAPGWNPDLKRRYYKRFEQGR